MKHVRTGRQIAVAALVALGLCGTASARTLHGLVKNGTTGKPAGDVKVILIALQGGMQPVSDTLTDANGGFTFDNPGLGAQPMLVRAVYKEVNFHQAAPPGKSEIEVEVFEPTRDPKTITVSSRVVVFQPNGDKLLVGEEYAVQNNSQPPQAYFKTDGNFEFTLPANASLQQVAAAGPAGMPVVQAPIEKENHVVAVAFAFRPGQSTVRYSYEMPYAGNTAAVTLPMTYTAGRLIVVAAPTVQITGEGLQAGGQEQGMNIYGRENVAANTKVTIKISGTAPPPAEAQSAGASGGQAGGEGGAGGTQIQVIPGRLDAMKWGIILGLAGLFALGAIVLSKKQIVVNLPPNGTMPAATNELAAAPSVSLSAANGGKLKRAASSGEVTPAHARVAAHVAGTAPATARTSAAAIAEVDAQVGSSLDALKDRIFRLELRRQAGTITEAEYTQERTRAEMVLRELVKG